MNVKKPVDYTAMFAALDVLMTATLPQMKLYYEIGRLVSGRPEKGAAIVAAEYLGDAYPDASGFSPRNLRRMREFYRTYESDLTVTAEAMTIGWTQNVVILEAELTLRERAWYIRAAGEFGWSKLELHRMIAASAHLEISLDMTDSVCYTEEEAEIEEASGYVGAQDSQCHGAGSSGSADGLPAVLRLLRFQFLNRGIHSQPLLVCGGSGWPMGVADGGGVPGHGDLQQALLQEDRIGQLGVVFRPRQLPAQWVHLRFPLRRRFGKLPGEIHRGRTASGRANAVQGSEADDWLLRRKLERFRCGNDRLADADLCHSPQLRVCSRQIRKALWLGHCPLYGDGGCPESRSDTGNLQQPQPGRIQGKDRPTLRDVVSGCI